MMQTENRAGRLFQVTETPTGPEIGPETSNPAVWTGHNQSQLCVIIVTVDIKANVEKAKTVAARCHSSGINHVSVFFGELYPAGEKTRHQAICDTHYRVVTKADACVQDGADILILEDDCIFTSTKAGADIMDSYKTLVDSEVSWALMFPGHIPLGPIIPRMKGLAITMFPFASHAYIMQRQRLKDVLQTVDEKSSGMWSRPLAVEGWTIFSSFEKFCMIPPVASQDNLPKEISGQMFSYLTAEESGLEPWMHAVHFSWWLLLAAVIVFAFTWYMRRSCPSDTCGSV